MKKIGIGQMKIGLVASALAVMLAAGLAASAFAAPPVSAASDRNPFEPVVRELNEINVELSWVLAERPGRHNSRELVRQLDALASRIDQLERRLESQLAKEPVPLSAAATAEPESVLEAADAVAQKAEDALAQYGSDWPQEVDHAVLGVEDAAQAVVNLVLDSLGVVPT
jgi:TolA-binding protein